MNRIALVLIARDEARCISRCLASAAPHVDEMIVLDTGSTDATPDLACAHGARVERFAWIDDFSAARNAALALTDAPWRLVLDADEWIAGGAAALASLRDTAPSFVGVLSVRSEVVSEGVALVAPSWLPRLLPAGVRYQGRIHEHPVSTLPRRRLPLAIGHDGYAPGPMAAKRGRNEALLRRAIAEAPGDAYLHYQLGKDLEVAGRFADALPCYDAAAAGVAPGAAWRHDLVVRRLFTLKRLRRFDDALAYAEAERPHYQDSPDYWFALGDLLLDAALADPRRAAGWLPRIEQSWRRAVEIGERPDLPDSVAGRGSFLAAGNLAAFHASLGQAQEADAWRAREREMRAACTAN